MRACISLCVCVAGHAAPSSCIIFSAGGDELKLPCTKHSEFERSSAAAKVGVAFIKNFKATRPGRCICNASR